MLIRKLKLKKSFSFVAGALSCAFLLTPASASTDADFFSYERIDRDQKDTVKENYKRPDMVQDENNDSISLVPDNQVTKTSVVPRLEKQLPRQKTDRFFSNTPEDLWARMRLGFGLPDFNNSLIREHENYYASHPEYLRKTFDRSRKYLYYIVEEVEKRGMPAEIALLPMIESAYNPKAYSRAHAAGIWQFIPSTGRSFGLKQDNWYDGRRDILAATKAALDYLQELYGMFGNWELALAAYNWGEGALGNSVSRNQARGESTDYFSLKMPSETRNYVPKLIAIRNIIANPRSFGLSLVDMPNRPYFTTIAHQQVLDVKTAAKLADMSVSEFIALNPGYSKTLLTAHSQNLVLPIDKAERFAQNLDQWKRDGSADNIPHVRPASNTVLAAVTTPEVELTPRKEERSERIKVTIPSSVEDDADLDSAKNAASTVAKQDEANNPPVPAARLQLLKPHIASVKLPTVETTHLVRAPVYKTVTKTVAQAPRELTIHKGDTLYSIAKRNNLSVDDLMKINKLSNNNLKLGQKLKLDEKSRIVTVTQKVLVKGSGGDKSLLALTKAGRKESRIEETSNVRKNTKHDKQETRSHKSEKSKSSAKSHDNKKQSGHTKHKK